MSKPTSSQINHYFAAFTGQMGARQVAPHLISLPKWWELRDARGRTPLMRALITKGFKPAMLGHLIEQQPDEMAQLLKAVDHGGKNIWPHLLYHYGYRSAKGQEWIPHFRNRAPLQSSPLTGRGIFVDLILINERKQWHEFFPKEGFARLMYALPGNAYETWWACNEDDAARVAHWMLTVRKPHTENMRSLISNLERCALVDPAGRRALPPKLRGALMLLEGIYGLRWAPVQEAMETGDWVMLSSKQYARLHCEIDKRPKHMRGKIDELLRHNELAALQSQTPSADGSARIRRLYCWYLALFGREGKMPACGPTT